jgi:hypothetical protein
MGTCADHLPQDIDYFFTDEAVAETLMKSLEAGETHVASEATVVTANNLSGPPLVLPLLAMGTCKKGTPVSHHMDVIKWLMEGWKWAQEQAKKRKLRLGHVLTISTDGDGKRRQAVTRLVNSDDEVMKGGVADVLKGLPLFDLHTGGEFTFTVDFDSRHCLKRWRYKLLFSNGGCRISPTGLLVNRGTLKVN